ncbi:hypothetical protein OG216_12645 [Streptomycetaceae bacterium NBC_01309]
MNSGNPGRFVAAGTLSALLLVVAFGNQWLWEDLLSRQPMDDDSASHVLGWLNTPHWVVDKSGEFARFEGTDLAGCLLGVAALLVTVALVLASAARRSDFNPFIAGWFSLVAGGAAYSVTSYLVSGMPGGLTPGSVSDERTLAMALDVLAVGGGYGLLAGWFVGIVGAFVAAGGSARTLFGADPRPHLPTQTPHANPYPYPNPHPFQPPAAGPPPRQPPSGA